ncbi:MAG: methyltransferase domain-containing protein [Nanoarchaeota archaeon]|nr:methyltransferase domain-containing protein [Nanoarchaeota archaeon]
MNFSKEYEIRFDENFGKGSFSKLLDAKRKYSNNSFIRINLSKTKIDNVEIFLKKNRVLFSKTFINNGIKIEKSFFNLSSSLLTLNGELYLQDLASQVPVNCINFEALKLMNKKIRILDMCASPGSKTSQIIDLMEYNNIDFELVALEMEKIRIQRLINNLQKQEFKNYEIYNIDALSFESQNKFDIIFLDAPCSGNLIEDKNWLNKRDFKGIKERAEIQKKLLKKADSLLANNGFLIYSTCSLELEENEENAIWALKNLNLKNIKCNLKFPFETAPEKIIKNDKIKNSLKGINCIRFMPYLSRTQGFFICCYRK